MPENVDFNDLPDDELREAAIGATVMQMIESARLYGLVAGGPQIDAERCDEAIATAKARGLTWNEMEVEAEMHALVAELSR